MNDGYRNLPAINEAGVFGTPATILPVETISEAAILSNFEAEYGRNSGAIVNIVTKSGTNDFHGALFEFFRNNALDARNLFNPEPDPQTAFRNNQFGGAIGGPIIRNRTFFYFAYEGQRERVGLNSSARVPDPREFAALGGASNPVIAALLMRNPWPAPNRPLPLFDDSGAPNLFVTTRASNDVDSLIGKIDHQFDKDNQLTGRYFFGNSNQSFPLAILGGNVLPGYNTVTPTRGKRRLAFVSEDFVAYAGQRSQVWLQPFPRRLLPGRQQFRSSHYWLEQWHRWSARFWAAIHQREWVCLYRINSLCSARSRRYKLASARQLLLEAGSPRFEIRLRVSPHVCQRVF
jgi:hypothetical protein